MIHLMKLELIKTKIGRPIRHVIITNFILLSLMIIMCFVSVYGEQNDEVMNSCKEGLIVTPVLVRAAFLIYSSVLMNRLTVAEYKERTVLQLFTYPIQRKKIFTAKLLIVLFFTMIVIAIASVFDNIIIYLVCSMGHLFEDATLELLLSYMPECLIGAFMCGFISLIPFYFGMRKKSGAVTILSSVILAVILCNNTGGDISNFSYMIRLLVIGGLSILLAIYTICFKLNQLENCDV